VRYGARVAAGVIGVAIVAMLLPFGAASSGASFTATATGDEQAVGTATIEPLTGLHAHRNDDGTVDVGWSVPSIRPDIDPVYTVERTVDGRTATIAPAITSADDAAGFVDELAVEAIFTGKRVTAVSVGAGVSCAVAEERAYCWGNESYGELGDDAAMVSRRAEPVAVGGALADMTVTAISVAEQHVCAIAEGAAYCWGRNRNGELGIGNTSDRALPAKVGGLLAGKTVTAIAAGRDHSCAVADGRAYCWGDGSKGALGEGGPPPARRLSPVAVTLKRAPFSTTDDGVLGGRTVADISAGLGFSCALTTDGVVACWGADTFGQLGRIGGSTTAPEQVEGLPEGVAMEGVSAGIYHTCAVGGGRAYCWGMGQYGQIGDGNTYNYDTPRPVRGVLAGGTIPVASIAAGYQQSCAVAVSQLYCWGDRGYGRLGDGATAGTVTRPELISGGSLAGAGAVTAVSGSLYNTCAIADENLFCWGAMTAGRLGDGRMGTGDRPDSAPLTDMQPTPVPVTTSGALRGVAGCAEGWSLGDDERCRPGAEMTVSYRIGYGKAGWFADAVELSAALDPDA
jgi:alpha-tubulin suppressor-like RCC1 family protein